MIWNLSTSHSHDNLKNSQEIAVDRPKVPCYIPIETEEYTQYTLKGGGGDYD